jgi:hypothetical protein
VTPDAGKKALHKRLLRDVCISEPRLKEVHRQQEEPSARLLFRQSARVRFRYGWFAIAKRHQGAHPISGLGYLVNRIEFGKIRRDSPV